MKHPTIQTNALTGQRWFPLLCPALPCPSPFCTPARARAFSGANEQLIETTNSGTWRPGRLTFNMNRVQVWTLMQDLSWTWPALRSLGAVKTRRGLGLL